MRIAIPVSNGEVCGHFGRCESFLLADVDPGEKTVGERVLAEPPEHSPGTFPRWLAERKVDVVIAGGIGPRAQGLFAAARIQVVTGVQGRTPDDVIEAFLADRLESGENVCDH